MLELKYIYLLFSLCKQSTKIIEFNEEAASEIIIKYNWKSSRGSRLLFLCDTLGSTVTIDYTAILNQKCMSRIQNRVYRNYFGSKNGSGVYQQILNEIRPHDIYIELFGGSAAIAQYKRPAWKTYINEINVKVYEKLRSGIDIPNCMISNQCALTFLSTFKFEPEHRYCIYLDPPYPLFSRRSQKEVYEYEMTDQQHDQLLRMLLVLPTNVDILISTYQNELYSNLLSHWNLHTFSAQTRAGLATEYLYMNFTNETGHLHQYNFLGQDYIDRQRIKRKIDREVNKLHSLPAKERNAILEALSQLA
jgi:DNA adenine methylase